VEGGFYGPRSEAWRLNREAMLLLGAGPRALLLQIAHPLVAAGVAEHSDFRSDPWARLSGTLRSYLRIVYGTADAAREEIRRLNDVQRQAAPDLVWQLLDWTSRGDVVIIEWQTTRNVNGVRFDWRGVDKFRLRNGKIIEERVYTDTAPLRAFRKGEKLEPITQF